MYMKEMNPNTPQSLVANSHLCGLNNTASSVDLIKNGITVLGEVDEAHGMVVKAS